MTLDLRPGGRRRLSPAEEEWMRRGIARAVSAAPDAIPSPLVVVVDDLMFGDCDFQPEGLEAVVYRWLDEVFELGLPPPSTRYLKAANRYEFTY